MFSSNNDLRPYCRQANLARFALMIASIMALIVGGTANAELIRINMTGTIEVNNDDHLLPDEFVTGTPFTGQFTYDTDAQDIIPENADRGVFTYAAGAPGVGIALEIAGHKIESDASFPIQIQTANDISAISPYQKPVAGDSLIVSRALRSPSGAPISSPVGISLRSYSQGIPLASPLGHVDAPTMEIRFFDSSGIALSDTELPLLFASDSFETIEILIGGIKNGGTVENPFPSFHISANIESISSDLLTVAVPEPSTFLLVALGALTFGLGRSIRLRSVRRY